MLDAKRREIIHGVWSLIADEGLAAVSVRAVAAAAGVSAGRVQHYFATKTDLVRASVTEMVTAAEEANPETGGDPTDPETLRTLLTHTFTRVGGPQSGISVFYAYLAASTADPWIGQELARAKTGQVNRVATCLAHQAPSLTSPTAKASELVALADGCLQAVHLGQISTEAAAHMIERAIRQSVPAAPQS